MEVRVIGELDDRVVRECYSYLLDKYRRELGNKLIHSESVDKEEIQDTVQLDLGRDDA